MPSAMVSRTGRESMIEWHDHSTFSKKYFLLLDKSNKFTSRNFQYYWNPLQAIPKKFDFYKNFWYNIYIS